MESDVGHVVVEISVRDEEENKTTPANPQFLLYFFILFCLAGFFALLLIVVQPMSKDHPFKARGGFYMIITIASLSVAVLTSGVLIFTSYYFQSCMMDIHYNILKTIGCSSATLAPLCLLALLYVPHNLNNWIAFSAMSVLFIGFLVAYYFLWKRIRALQQADDKPNELPIHPSAFLLFLSPLSMAMSAFIPPNYPRHIKFSLLCLCSTIVVAAACYLVVYILYLLGKNKVCNLELHQVSQQDKTITHP